MARRDKGNDLIVGLDRNVKPVVMTREQRGKHLYAVGATGTGKSKFLEFCIRQDILNWHRHHSPVVVIDKHGSLFDSLMQWICAKRLTHLPLIPIDLRRPDYVVCYNVLRSRLLENPAVVVGGLVRSILHAWGQGNLDDTPRLARWLSVSLMTLYEGGHTLLESLALLTQPDVRRAMSVGVKDFAAQSVWRYAEGLRHGEFDLQVESTLNRLLRFLNNKVMRATLCQNDLSLDFSDVLKNGSIVLVSLATAGGQVDEEDARTFGSMLMGDLWTAAVTRGKKDEGGNEQRPIYAYVDEFQEFVSPSIAETLDQARGFGLHMTLAHQFPSQLRTRGPEGQRLLDSVMANARSKVVFELEHPTDLAEMALWLGRNDIDLDEIKHQHYSSKVLDYSLQYVPSFSSSATQGTASTDTTGSSEGWSESESKSATIGGSRSRVTGRALGTSSGSSDGHTDGESWVDYPEDPFMMGNEPLPMLSASDSHSTSAGISQIDSTSLTEAQSWNESLSTSTSTNGSESKSHSVGRSQGRSKGTSWSPMLIPILGKEAGPPQFRSLEEQLFRLTQHVSLLAERHAMVRLAGVKRPVDILVPNIRPGDTTRQHAAAWSARLLSKLPIARPMAEALRRLDERAADLARIISLPVPGSEPSMFGRRVASREVRRNRDDQRNIQ